MKKVFGFVIALVFLLGLSSSVQAGYAIELKNGRVLLAPAFWEEKGIIKFYWERGTASIPMDIIRSISFTKEVAVMTPPELKEPIPEPKAVVSEEKKTEEPGPGKEKIDAGYYKEQKALFMGKYDQAYHKYLEASSRHDGEAKKQAWEEFTRYAGQVTALKEELKEKNQGILPNWWSE